MTVMELGALGEFVGSIAVIATLIYLALQIRQNTSQQKREETISIQHGQNTVVALMQDPAVVRAYVKAADGDTPASVLMFEPATTRNTGDVDHKLTIEAEDLERI